MVSCRPSFAGVLFVFIAVMLAFSPSVSGASDTGASESERAVKGYQLVREDKFDEGLSLLFAEAAKRNHLAMRFLAKIYNDTTGRYPIAPDPDAARCWLRKSGALFKPPPIVIESDLDWNHTAARHGYAGAQLAMALAYAGGERIEKNMTEAAAWFLLAADRLGAEWSYREDEKIMFRAIVAVLKSDAVENAQARARELRDLPTMKQDFPCPLFDAE